MKNPYSINFKQLQRYNFSFFSLEEIVLFEYFMLLAQIWDYKPFYHSTDAITRETGIKRGRMETVMAKFESMGILHVEVKGFPKVRHFSINTDVILREFKNIFQPDENNHQYAETYKLYVEINKLYVKNSVQEKLIKETKKETKDKIGSAAGKPHFSLEDAKKQVENLELMYNKRRDYLSAHTKHKYPPVVLGFKNTKTYELVQQAMNERASKVIENAWLVMCDKITRDGQVIRKLLPYFFSLKDGEFSVIDSYADVHNTTYAFNN